MTKYARLRDGHLIDVYTAPGDFADLDTLERCLPGDPFIVVPSDAENGARDNGDGTYTNPTPPTPVATPLIMSKTAFNLFGWAQIGMAAFQKVLEDTRNSAGTTTADYEARAAVNQYDSALTFEKSQVEQLGLKIKAAGHMTDEQYALMTGDSWPAE
jgi:hypothetical protein